MPAWRRRIAAVRATSRSCVVRAPREARRCPDNGPMTADTALETLSIDANGLRFHALAAGPADGPLVVLLHGFPEAAHGWRHQFGPLAAAGFRVVAPDQRGIGRSSKPEGLGAYRLGLLADDVVALVRALGRERAQVVGHDWGGVVAWHLAMHHAAVIERAAILDAPHPAVFRDYVRTHPSQRLKSWYMLFFQLPWLPEAVLRAGDFRRLGQALVATSRPGTFTPADLEAYRDAWRQPGALSGMLNWYRAVRAGSGSPHVPGPVAVPVRLLWGDRDHALEPALADASIARCAAGEVFHLPEATHWLQHEEAGRVNALLLDFLRR